MLKNPDAVRAVLRAVSLRPEGHGYARPDLPGFTREEIDEASRQLWKWDLIDAATIGSGLGDGNEPEVAPSNVTEKGRQFLVGLEHP